MFQICQAGRAAGAQIAEGVAFFLFLLQEEEVTAFEIQMHFFKTREIPVQPLLGRKVMEDGSESNLQQPQ